MKIVRYETPSKQIEFGALDASGKVFKLRGDIFDKPEITSEPAKVAKLLAPLAPIAILGIGLNYKKHAEECGAKFPEYPVLFAKGLNTLQNPDDPIEIPTFMKSDEVDYECELAVVIGKKCKNVSRARRIEKCARLHVRQRCQRARLANQARRRPMESRESFSTLSRLWARALSPPTKSRIQIVSRSKPF